MADTDRQGRAARNQALFREVNDRISELNESFGEIKEVYEIACECSNIECIALVTISPEEYLSVRASPRRFVVLPEHVVRDVERVVSKRQGHVVVEKLGAAGAVATELAEPED